MFITNLSIWITFFRTSFQDGENHKEYFCENLSAQIKNSTTVSEWKKHKDMFLSNMGIHSNQLELVKGLTNTQMIKRVSIHSQ
jgi:hypothetical protein